MKTKNISILLLVFLLTSCITNVKYSGHAVSEDDLSQIKIASSTQDEVKSILGSPTLDSNYGHSSWYYIHDKMEYYGFMNPVTKERSVIAIVFNKENLVTEIEKFTLDHANNLVIEKDQTVSQGTTGNVIKHFMNNVGKFNKAGSKTTPGKPRGI